MSQTRDQIINYLLQQDDQKDRTIADLQKQIAQLTKELEEKNATAKPISAS